MGGGAGGGGQNRCAPGPWLAPPHATNQRVVCVRAFPLFVCVCGCCSSIPAVASTSLRVLIALMRGWKQHMAAEVEVRRDEGCASGIPTAPPPPQLLLLLLRLFISLSLSVHHPHRSHRVLINGVFSAPYPQVFISHIFLRLLTSPHSSFEQKMAVLAAFRTLVTDASSVLEMFINYVR